MRWQLIALLALAACGGGGGDDDHATPIDAPAASIDGPAAPDATPAPDAAPGQPTHTLFLNFGGVTLHPGFESAVNNTSSLINNTSTISAFSQATLVRDAIVAEATATLAPYDLAVVTTRPASGPYWMIVVGGTGPQVGFPAGSVATAPAVCGLTPNMISFLFDVDTNVHDNAALIVALQGLMAAIPTSSLTGDCMCFNDSNCYTTPLAAACTIGGADTPMSSQDQCETVAPFDEDARWLTALGPHP